jgi:hypothetical protein
LRRLTARAGAGGSGGRGGAQAFCREGHAALAEARSARVKADRLRVVANRVSAELKSAREQAAAAAAQEPEVCKGRGGGVGGVGACFCAEDDRGYDGGQCGWVGIGGAAGGHVEHARAKPDGAGAQGRRGAREAAHAGAARRALRGLAAARGDGRPSGD